jgi:type II restriction enzyme
MKTLKYYESKQLKTPQQVFDFFMSTLTDSIFTWDYFVDFKKSLSNVKEIEAELKALNSLLGKDDSNIDNEFLNIIRKNPKVRKVLPILIALRMDKLSSTPIIDNLDSLTAVNKRDLFNPRATLSSSDEKDLLKFLSLSGLRDFMLNSGICSLTDYCRGVEVGMDTNARKNRTGTTMENILENFLSKFCKKHDFSYISQATKKKIFDKWGLDIEIDKIDRHFDFVIKANNNKLFVFEVNYYSAGGSKLKATAGEYKSLYDLLKPQDITFVWVTDGRGWETAQTALFETFTHNEYLFNLNLIANGALDEVLL